MKYHKVTAQITQLLQNHNIRFGTFEHEPVKTSDEAAKMRHGYTLHQGAKAIIVRAKIVNADKKFAMLVIPGDVRFNTGKVKRLLGAKDVRFATEEEVSLLTDGVQPGGVPPFGNLFGLEVFVDPLLLENEKIIFSAGDRRFSIGMNSTDYIILVNPKITSIV